MYSHVTAENLSWLHNSAEWTVHLRTLSTQSLEAAGLRSDLPITGTGSLAWCPKEIESKLSTFSACVCLCAKVCLLLTSTKQQNLQSPMSPLNMTHCSIPTKSERGGLSEMITSYEVFENCFLRTHQCLHGGNSYSVNSSWLLDISGSTWAQLTNANP